jgi:IS30 family transposase
MFIYKKNKQKRRILMSQVYCIRTRRKGKHLTFDEREELEAIVNKNNALPKGKRLSQRKMAERLGVSPATVNRELRRGKVILLDTYLREVVSYSAMKAQDDYEGKASAKGPQLKIGNNHKLAEKIEDYITEKKYSPYSTIKELRDDPDYQKTPICERTLYNYIDRELLLNVTKKDLPRKGKKSKRKYRRVTKRIRDVEAKRIDDRPEGANERSEIGHWEMDCVESGRGKGRACLLVLNERRSRETLIFKLRSQTQKEVLRQIDEYENKIGFKRLRRGLPGYLILFATHAFAPQRQLSSRKPPSPLVFLPISTHFTATLGIPLSSPTLKNISFRCTPEVKPRNFTPDLTPRLHALYTQ